MTNVEPPVGWTPLKYTVIRPYCLRHDVDLNGDWPTFDKGHPWYAIDLGEMDCPERRKVFEAAFPNMDSLPNGFDFEPWWEETDDEGELVNDCGSDWVSLTEV